VCILEEQGTGLPWPLTISYKPSSLKLRVTALNLITINRMLLLISRLKF